MYATSYFQNMNSGCLKIIKLTFIICFSFRSLVFKVAHSEYGDPHGSNTFHCMKTDFILLKQIAFDITKYNLNFKKTFQISKTQSKFQKHFKSQKHNLNSVTQFKFQKRISNLKNTIQISKTQFKFQKPNSNFINTFQISKTQFTLKNAIQITET